MKKYQSYIDLLEKEIAGKLAKEHYELRDSLGEDYGSADFQDLFCVPILKVIRNYNNKKNLTP